MATQAKSGLPGGEFSVIDNGAAPSFPTLNAGTSIGYDTIATGTQSQGTNPIADTGTVLIDASGNDTVYPDPQVATLKGNPVSGVQPTYATVTKVLTNPLSATVNWKNPA